MKRFVIASHGNFAAGILDSLELVMGRQENFMAMCAYRDGENDIRERVRKIIETRDPADEMIIVTDLFRGSVNNEFMIYTKDPGVYLVAGLNLALLLEILVNQEKDTPVMIR
ncbi:MAG: PTS fructose transporter subunit IIA [Clostridiales bacterium]|nr:PTS fructose transporter subunit IIA [Clostridiales bacterium]